MRNRNAGVIAACLTVMAIMLGAAIGGCIDMTDDGTETLPSAAATTTPPTVWSGAMNVPPPITEAATTTKPAVRAEVQIQVSEPPVPVFDPVAHVNDLNARGYCWQCPEPAMEAYRVVAAWYGWDESTIEARADFVQRVMATESAFCWNARAWSHGTALQMPCGQIGQGTRDDVGFGQITNVLRPLTCEKAGICSIADTIAAPWPSMVAYVVVLDELGKGPWCFRYSDGRLSHHIANGDCATWPG